MSEGRNSVSRSVTRSINTMVGTSKKNQSEFRTVHVNSREQNAQFKFKGNFVRTTRYTVLSFLPKNIFEQMHRLANVYFLGISLLQVFTTLSPTGRYTTIGPLMLILGVSAIKDAIEDFARYKSDVETNNRKLDILNPTTGAWDQLSWKEVVVGDIVRIKNREFFPADLLLLCSSEPLGMAYIETSNLDGETNLKIRQALPETNEPLTAGQQSKSSLSLHGLYDDTEPLMQLRATLTCELPNNRLNEFDGTIEGGDGKKLSLNAKQVLLRGSQLRQTKWAIGLVVFSGYDTKVVMNSSKAPTKRSNIELRTNDFIIVILSLMTMLCLTAAIAAVVYADDEMGDAWYLPDADGGDAFPFMFATYLILLSTMVPISLYVTLEIVKMFQAFHINWDLDMFDPESGKHAVARSSGLNEELGQVEYIFSDKTGTLTQNLMEFRKCTVGAVRYGTGTTEIGRAAALHAGKVIEDDEDEAFEKPDPMFNFRDPSFIKNLRNGTHPDSELIREFLTLLAVCHTVVPEGEGEHMVYQAASPDEAALVAAAKCFDFVFHTRTPKSIEVDVEGETKSFQLLNVLEFNSDRKRMSVIVKLEDGSIRLYCKGADTKIYERLAPNQEHKDITLQHLEEFASEGLRTLCCAYRQIEESEWVAWNDKFEQAATALAERQKKVDEVSELIEKDLVLLGSTAIEDKLQDGVPDCIATLAKANIKIWVLTGDKQETAINIGFACALLTDDMTLLILNETKRDATTASLKARWDQYNNLDDDEKREVAIIIDGKTLEFVLESHELKMSFLELGKRSKAVVCCRVTPSQKANVTNLVKDNDGRICLAVGDGANDVAMIQAAHVGIGISGKEGLQAVQASDYAIAQFRFLKKLLLCHGHWNYRRVSRVITFNFYKNMCLYMTQYWFGLYNLISGQSLYEAWTQGSFNVFFTSLPIMAYGILDQDVGIRAMYTFPSIYTIGQDKLLFNARMFAYWLGNAFWHSVVVFLIPLFIFLSIVTEDGQDRGLSSMGLYTYTAVVYVVSGKILIMTRSHNWVTAMSIVLSIMAWFLWLLVYSLFILEADQLTIWRLGYAVLELPNWWLATLLITIAALSRDFAWRCYKDIFLPSPIIMANYVNKYNKWEEVEQARESAAMEARKRSLQNKKDDDRRRSTVANLRKCQSGLGFAFAASEPDSQGHTDWEDRIRKVLHNEERRKRRQKKRKNNPPAADGGANTLAPCENAESVSMNHS